MENFGHIMDNEKSLENIRGIFDKEDIKSKLQKLEQITLRENFWKDKNLVKKLSNKKTFEDIINSYNKSSNDLKI